VSLLRKISEDEKQLKNGNKGWEAMYYSFRWGVAFVLTRWK
jgi:hypothetical protein